MAKHSRQSTIDALNNYSQRQLAQEKPKEIKRNEKPEKDVERECLEWMRARGWNVEIYEAKATWSSNAGAWVQKGMKAGTCDCMGNTGEGLAIAIEFKAPGALSTFNSDKRYLQKKFIVDKINTNTFACVVDSVSRLEIIFKRWSELVSFDKNSARNYLLSMLPQQQEKTRLKSEKLFDDE